LYEAKGKVLIDFNIGGYAEAEQAELLIEDTENAILLGDRGYWV